MPLIELKNASKTYYIGGNVPVHALRGLSFSVEPGEFVAIMGPSGSGKSTLLAILGLLDKADSGSYILLGKDITGFTEKEYSGLRNKFFGFIFQTFNLLAKLKVTENTMLPFIYAGNITHEKRDKAVGILSKIGLGERLGHRPNQLSGGQQQRVAIARALVNDPAVILADEPTGNLDSKSSREIMDILKELNSQGNTIIMVTHETDIAAYASRVVTLLDGQIASDERRTAHTPTQAPEFSLSKKRGLSFESLKNYCYEAILALTGNKLRSFLSILGVMIGVAAVIAMLALGAGAQRNIEETLSNLGTNLLRVRISGTQRGISMGVGSITRFTFADLDALRKIDYVDRVVPYASGRVQSVFENKNWNTSVIGTSTDYLSLRNTTMDKGRFFNESESIGRAKVAVLGSKVALELFGTDNPIGRSIRINRISFNVIGVMPTLGGAGFMNPDDNIIIPIKTAMYRLLGTDYISYFEVQVSQMDRMKSVQNEIVNEMVRLHRLPESQRETIDVMNMAEIQQAANSMISALAYLLGSIAAVSLLVGGIGIMNIMLVMVMERTHEIGLRKALGAGKRDILVQFLVESVLVCLVGGTIGILFGSLISWTLSAIIQWRVIISLWSVLLAFTFSVLVGLIFGIWPAWRAAKLLPIEALRYE
jgi:macrolide transport system ATP-binding/permease protein